MSKPLPLGDDNKVKVKQEPYPTMYIHEGTKQKTIKI